MQLTNQTEQSNSQGHLTQLKLKTFAQWRAVFVSSKQRRHNQKLGLQVLFEFQTKQENKEKFRLLSIWKEDTKLATQQRRMLNSVLSRQCSKICRIGLYKWVEYCLEQKALVKQHILACQFSHDQQKQILLHAFREVVERKRNKRQNKLALFLKEWRSCLSRKRYMQIQAQKLAQLKFELQAKLLAACFQQLRLEKEQQKVYLMVETWTEQVQPSISQLKVDISEFSTHELQVKKIRCLGSLSDAAKRFLASYFEHWKNLNIAVKQKLDRNMRAMILRKYRNTLLQALSKLRDGKQFHVLSGQRGTVDQEQTNQRSLQNQIISLTQRVNDEEFKLGYQKRLMLQHAIAIFNTRLSKFGLIRWRQRCRGLAELQRAAASLSERLKRSMRRSGWNHYRHQIDLCRQQDKDEALIGRRLQLRLLRTKRRIFDAIRLFYKQFCDQKTYWKITLTNLEVCLKRKGLRRWIEQGNLKQQQLFRKSQNLSSLTFDQMNTILGKASTQLQTQKDENRSVLDQLRNQAQRVLSNTFARSYYTLVGYGLRKWSEVSKFEKHRDQIIKRTLQHKIKHQFLVLRAAWKNWVAKTLIKEAQDTIEYVQMKNEEAHQLINYQQQIHQTQAGLLDQNTQQVHQSVQRKHRQLLIAVKVVTNQAQNDVYQSQLRYIFQHWVLFYKRQKQFASVIQKVISKSLWQDGFDRIRLQYQANLQSELQHTHLTAMKRLFWHKKVGQVVQMWKSRMMQQDQHSLQATLSDIESESQHFQSNLTLIRQVNTERSQHRNQESKIKQTFKAWTNVVTFNRSMRQSSNQLQEAVKVLEIKRALRLWQSRNNTTLSNLRRIQKFAQKRRSIYIRSIFIEIKRRCSAKKHLCAKLRLVAQNFDRLNTQASFELIMSFAKLRRVNANTQKAHSAQSMCQVLHKAYQNKLTQSMNQIKAWFQKMKMRDSKLRSLIGNQQSEYFRSIFLRWRDHTHYLATVEDVNLQGPVVEEVLDAQADYGNYRMFMSGQGYTKLQIQQVTEKAQDRQLSLISSAVGRWKHFNEQGYLKPKMFDRWRMYVKMRRLVKYLLRNIENRLLPVKSDLSVAFCRWKTKFNDSNRVLNGLDRQVLIQRCCQNEEQLRRQDQTGQQKEYEIIQLNFERDELIDNYVRAQKLAIGAGRDHIERGLAKTIGVLSDNNQKQKRSQLEQVLQRNIELIAGLKDRIMHLEFDNNTLATDNEELRQFSLDGFEIARNAQQLGSEREKLSIDLADKAKTIKRLLDEHDQLERSLREQQYKAEALIQQSLNQRQNWQTDSLARQ